MSLAVILDLLLVPCVDRLPSRYAVGEREPTAHVAGGIDTSQGWTG